MKMLDTRAMMDGWMDGRRQAGTHDMDDIPVF
jgi:hypothetical protein